MSKDNSKHLSRNCRVATVVSRCVFVLSVLLCRGLWGEETADEVPMELRPYKVQLLIAFDSSVTSKHVRTEILQATRLAARRCVGSSWDVTVTEVDWLQPVSADALSRLTAADLAGKTQQDVDKFDVWQIVGVRSSGSGFRIDVRSWQPEVGVQSDVFGSDAYDSRDVSLTLLQLAHKAFSPIGLVDSVDGTKVRVLLRAGAISVPDSAFSLAKNSKLFVAVLASRNREQKIERLMTVPWTYLSVVEPQGVGLQCELQSGLRAPISGKPRGRTSTLAVAIKSTRPSTLLDLATQTKPSLPLVAHRIEVRDSPRIPQADAPRDQDEHLLDVLLTDRRGQVTIPADSGDLVWLMAYSGKNLLARVPFVPGMSDRMRLEVPDDSARLTAEAELYTLQGQLIEAVAARTTTIARIRAAIKKNDLVLAKAAEAELVKLPSSDVYLERVTFIRLPSIKAAKARKDRLGEARITRMCDEMSELIKEHLSEDKRQAVMEELKVMAANQDREGVEKPEPDKATK